MPDNSKKFHEFALKSMLFKGRSDWYFCYLKTEKIAHALVAVTAAHGGEEPHTILRPASELPQHIAYLAAGDMDVAVVLADVFAILSKIRMAAAEGTLSREAAAVLAREYENVAERLVAGSHPSPFVAAEDLRIAPLSELESALPAPRLHIKDIKDTKKLSDKTQSERMSLILNFIQKNKQASIKDIAAVVKGCSEKTIQRELGSLIEQGLVRKVGERRWSVYMPA